MTGINWREKFLAVFIHFLITSAIAALAALVIFLVWFPGAFAWMSGGTRLFLVVVAVDIGLGPLISLVIYSSSKSRRALITDYSIVGAVQLAALLYGVFAVASSRPIFIAFTVDRLEVVAALELTEEDLAGAPTPQFRSKSWTGPRLAAVEMPADPKERSDLTFQVMTSGKDVYLMPKYYRPYQSAASEIAAKSKPLNALLEGNPKYKHLIEESIDATQAPRSELRWLDVHHRFGFAVALIDTRTQMPLRYLPIETK